MSTCWSMRRSMCWEQVCLGAPWSLRWSEIDAIFPTAVTAWTRGGRATGPGVKAGAVESLGQDVVADAARLACQKERGDGGRRRGVWEAGSNGQRPRDRGELASERVGNESLWASAPALSRQRANGRLAEGGKDTQWGGGGGQSRSRAGAERDPDPSGRQRAAAAVAACHRDGAARGSTRVSPTLRHLHRSTAPRALRPPRLASWGCPRTGSSTRHAARRKPGEQKRGSDPSAPPPPPSPQPLCRPISLPLCALPSHNPQHTRACTTWPPSWPPPSRPEMYHSSAYRRTR